LLVKTQARFDNFVTEQYAEELEAIFARWSSGLLQSPQNVTAIEDVLASEFSGGSLRAAESRVVRSGSIEARRNTFTSTAALGDKAFLQDFRASLSKYSKILIVDFQVTSITQGSMAASPSPVALLTNVRYELVATGQRIYREQRVGYWQLSWERSQAGEWRVRSWQGLDETQSRSTSPCFVDISAAVFSGNPSYSSQLLHGSDYWRTILDGACGIDIYGHNGVSVGDIDGDGFDDLYVCQPGGLPNRLFRNRGDGTFEDITEASGVGVIENTACALFVDVNNDGRQDLIVVRTSGPMLFLNEGGGKFRQKADAFQFASPPQGTFTGAAVADYDRDGWVDIYFCLYIYYQGTNQYKYPSPYYAAENGPPNFMMRNNRDGTFRDVTAESGLTQNNTRYSFCCGWADFNRDGWPDLYVVNDFGRKNLYRNNGDGTFTDVAAEADVEDIGAGMSVCWFDYDNDGAEDLYVADMWTAAGERISMQDNFKETESEKTRALYHKHAMGNSLFRNGLRSGGSAFADATRDARVEIGRWAWSSDSWDFDHDGFADLYITNGMVSGPAREDLNSFFWRQVVANSPAEAKPSHDYEQGWSAINELIRADGTWSGYERNIFYANNGDGTFGDISGVIGLDFLEDGRAFALADFDHDGRLEVFLKNRNGPQLRLLKNVMEGLPPSIAFRLRGTKSNRDAIGTVIEVETEQGRQVHSLQAGSGFLSQHSKDVFFGLGAAKGPVRASIRWPSGLVQELRDLPLNHRIVVEEGSAEHGTEAFQLSAERGRAALTKEATRIPRQAEAMPIAAETWLLAPFEAPDFSLLDLDKQTYRLSALRGKPLLLSFGSSGAEGCTADWSVLAKHYAGWKAQGLQLLAVALDAASDSKELQHTLHEQRLPFPILHGTADVGAVYNILYRYLFDRHRDLVLPTSFLIDAAGVIVKVYQGPIDVQHVEEDFRHIPKNSVERLARAIPFPGVTDTVDFGRNYLSYGSVFFQRGYMDQALASFKIALRDDLSSAEALYGIGSVYLEQQKLTEARDSFERALKLRASYPDTLANSWNNLGLIAGRDGRAQDAVNYFQAALKVSPDHLIALDNLGSAYRQQRLWEDARTTYEHALAVSPNDAEANYGLGMVFAQHDDTVHAFDLLQKALKLRPIYPEALNNLGILYLRTQRQDQAIATFEECIRVAPSFEQCYFNLARVYALQDTPEKARALLIELLKQHPGQEQAQKMLEQLPSR
jgi:tetratricopeptide (TPR) repeat protein/peroxiredoxin